jgi:hypothetical protein
MCRSRSQQRSSPHSLSVYVVWRSQSPIVPDRPNRVSRSSIDRGGRELRNRKGRIESAQTSRGAANAEMRPVNKRARKYRSKPTVRRHRYCASHRLNIRTRAVLFVILPLWSSMESALSTSTSNFHPCGGGYPRVTGSSIFMVHEQHAVVLAKSSSFGAGPLPDLNYPLSKALP